MSADQTKVVLYMKNMFNDLLFINSVIATQLVKITENLTALRHGEEFLKKSTILQEQNDLNKDIIDILDKYGKLNEEIDRKNRLEKHVLRHLEDSK